MFETTIERFELDLGLFMSSASLGCEEDDWEPEQVARLRAWELLHPDGFPEDATFAESMAIRYGGHA